MYESLRADRRVAVDCDTICDSVAVPYITDEMFPLLRSIVDRVTLVSDEKVRRMVKQLAVGNKIVAEPSGALAAAAASLGRSCALSCNLRRFLALLDELRS